MTIKDKVLKILKKEFGFDSLRMEQENIILSVLNSKDTLGIMPTGGGKSLCYQLPAMYLEGLTIVISPLISLMEDQVANLEQYGISSAFLNSTQSLEERRNIEAKLKNSEIKVLYIAPEGILNPHSLVFLRSLKVSLIAIDEAHCVSQWGHEFRSDYTRLHELRKFFPDVVFLALTATADKKTQEDICRQLGLVDANIFIAGFDRPNIKYMVYERTDELAQLNKFLQENHKYDTGIVYCLSRKKVEKIADKLKQLGYNAFPYHAGMSSKDRTRIQKKFKTQDQIIIVATIAFGMGIDRPDVRFVAHLDLPKSIEGYYQETGRAGRDGKESNAWMVYGFSDLVKHNKMLDLTEASEDYKSIARSKLDKMLALCETTHCRRKYLIEYFQQNLEKDCGNCDSCLEPVETWDASVASQKILSAIYRTGQSFGASHIIDVLRGSQNAKVLNSKHNELSVFNIGSDLSKNEWNSILRQLLHRKYIFIKDYEYRSLALSKKAKQIFNGSDKVILRKLRSFNYKKTNNSVKSIEAIKSHGQEELFQDLRTHRRELSEELGLAPYLIFSDKSLHDMCNILPNDKSSMLLVHGVGESKFEKYGESFLEIISNYN